MPEGAFSSSFFGLFLNPVHHDVRSRLDGGEAAWRGGEGDLVDAIAEGETAMLPAVIVAGEFSIEVAVRQPRIAEAARLSWV